MGVSQLDERVDVLVCLFVCTNFNHPCWVEFHYGIPWIPNEIKWTVQKMLCQHFYGIPEFTARMKPVLITKTHLKNELLTY